MAGAWAQIYQDHWYPYWPNQRVYWFETREQIDDSAKHVFERIAYFHKREGWDSAHWFPSKYARSFPHIRAVEGAWRETLHEIGSRYYPLVEFAKSFRAPNNTSESISFLRQYSAMFRKANNVAELSRSVQLRRKLLITSKSYE